MNNQCIFEYLYIIQKYTDYSFIQYGSLKFILTNNMPQIKAC